jgi:hypothetical protein
MKNTKQKWVWKCGLAGCDFAGKDKKTLLAHIKESGHKKAR